MSRSVRILREPDVRSALGMAACIDAVEAAFVAYAAGKAELPGVIHLDVPEARGEIHVKAGHLHGSPTYAVKVASGFYAQSPPALDGLVMVFDATSGAPVAFLLDNGYLTDLRTGAAGGVAARHLAPEGVEVVAVIGTGVQARQQVAALRVVRREIAEIRIWGRNPEHAARAADEIGATVADTIEAAVRDAGVVISCTAARAPLLRAAWLRPGTHVTAVGSDGPGKQELDPEILRTADVLVVDAKEQCLRLGELQHAPEQAERVVELGSICAGTPGRTSEGQRTVCDLTGVGIQDVAVANAVLANADRTAGETFAL